MKKTLFVFLCIFLLAGCSFKVQPKYTEAKEPHLITPGDVFYQGSYIEFEGVNIEQIGDVFSVTNNRKDVVRISVAVVGVQSNGEYDLIQVPAFNGTDETQYKNDLKENGWAISQPTNMVRPGETLFAKLSIFDFGEGFPSPDIDKDGYYDIVFSIHPQESEDVIQTSTNDPVSPVYKLKAN